MRTVLPRNFRHSVVQLSVSENQPITGQMVNRLTEVLYLNNNYYSLCDRYRVISIPLFPDSYDVNFVSVDDLNNLSSGVTGSETILSKLFYPTSFSIDNIATNTVSLSWEAPVSGGKAITGYKVYGNGGDGLIDRTSPLGTYGSGVLSCDLTLANGDWMFVVESYDAISETINYYALSTTLPVINTVPKAITESYVTENVTLSNVNVGCCNIQFVWVYGTVSKFNVYHDSGTGTIDWVTVVESFNRQSGYYQNFTTGQICFAENTEYKFGIRAESGSGIEEKNTTEYTVMLDGISPDNINNLEVET